MTADPILETFEAARREQETVDDPILATFDNARRGSVERFARGVGSAVDPRPIVDMVADRPESDPRAKVGGAVMDTLRGLSGFDQIKQAAQEVGQAITGSDPSQSRMGHLMDAASSAQAALPGVGPIVQGAQKDILSSASSGDMAGALGKATGIVGSALAPQIGSKMTGAIKARGAGMADDALSSYKSAMSTPETAPLVESIGEQMMSRGMRGDPAKLARNAGAAADMRDAQRAAIRPPQVGELGSSGAAVRGMDRKSLAIEAKFQRDVQTVAEALSAQGSKSLKNVLVDGAKAIVKGGDASITGTKAEAAIAAALQTVGGPAGRVAVKGARMTAAVLPALKEFAQLPIFRSALPIYKRQFGQALQSGKIEAAAEIAAGIATGQLADEFGHRNAIAQLSTELEPLQMPELKRQAIGAKKGYYTDPDGKEIAIPQGVMAAFMDAKSLDETNSPVSQWLGAMVRQNQIKGGGTLTFR